MIVKDPVCGQEIESSSNEGHSEYDGHSYFFCSDNCKTMFELDPQRCIVAAYSR